MAEIILVRGTRHEVHECLTCGCIIVASERLLEEKREKGGYYHCQNGHTQGWSKEASEVERLRRERDRLKQDASRLQDGIASRDREIEAQKKKAARAAKRASAGTCPCCTRTFANMARHMKTQHPDYNVVPLQRKA